MQRRICLVGGVLVLDGPVAVETLFRPVSRDRAAYIPSQCALTSCLSRSGQEFPDSLTRCAHGVRIHSPAAISIVCYSTAQTRMTPRGPGRKEWVPGMGRGQRHQARKPQKSQWYKSLCPHERRDKGRARGRAAQSRAEQSRGKATRPRGPSHVSTPKSVDTTTATRSPRIGVRHGLRAEKEHHGPSRSSALPLCLELTPAGRCTEHERHAGSGQALLHALAQEVDLHWPPSGPSPHGPPAAAAKKARAAGAASPDKCLHVPRG